MSNTNDETELTFIAKLRNRIVNQGMIPLIESNISSYGRNKKLDHIEDLVFKKGSNGIKSILNIVDELESNAAGCASVKFDGRPSIIFGRNEKGQFVLTDVSAFHAATYDGRFSKLDHLISHLKDRDANDQKIGRIGIRSTSLAPQYKKLWDKLESVVPKKFRGYVQGDLLYTDKPELEHGLLIFKPNTITYRINMGSDVGKLILPSDIGIALHTLYDKDGNKVPLDKCPFTSDESLALLPPLRASENLSIKNIEEYKEIKKLFKECYHDINRLFSPSELRQQQIIDFPRVCVEYINYCVKNTNMMDFKIEQLLDGFFPWLEKRVTNRKFTNIMEYLQSPTSNFSALVSTFTLFCLSYKLKMHMLNQLDVQEPGHEGWVIVVPSDSVKLVNRFEFSRNNFLNNNHR